MLPGIGFPCGLDGILRNRLVCCDPADPAAGDNGALPISRRVGTQGQPNVGKDEAAHHR